MKRIALAVLAAALAPAAALAQASTWNMDPAHSHASFTVRHLAISNVRGEFGKMSGKIVLDEKDPTRSQVEATIDVDTVNTREPKRDADLRSPNFFDAQNHPKITFRSTRVERAGDGRYEVTGDLTIRGNTRPVTLDVDELTRPIRDQRGAMRLATHATTRIVRQDFGLTWNAMVEAAPVVGDEVRIEISAEFVKAPDGPAGQAKAEDAAAGGKEAAAATGAKGKEAAGAAGNAAKDAAAAPGK
jgi:polyisoprenoid-binding protein YceI